MKEKLFIFAAFVLVAIMVPCASAQDNETLSQQTVSLNNPGVSGPILTDPVTIGEPSWGVATGSNLWIHASEFAPVFGQVWGWIYPGYLYKTTGSGQSFCTAINNLQRGAYINGIDVVYYDNDASNIHAFLQRMYGETSPASDQPWDFYSTGTPGYASSYTAVGMLYDPWATGASHAFWWLCVDFPITGNTLRLRGVRIYYVLQVSPAPGSATFTDVPTSHIFFQFIEALADSGITTGCTATQYCPDQAVTRGQMAVFLARIVGLHYDL